MALDTQIIQEAKKEFGEEFSPKIAELGYNLAYGITKVDDSFAIAARVQSEHEIPAEVKQQIEGILPDYYEYKEHKILVELVYTSIARAQAD